MNKFLFTVLACFLLSSIAFSQNGTFDKDKFEESLKNSSFKERFEAANSLIDDQLYELSLPIWKSLVEEQPENGNVNYKYGFCLLKSNENRKDALPYLKKAQNFISKNYDPFDVSETNSPIESEFYLGKAYHHNYELDEAIKTFESFSTKIKKGKHILSKYIDVYINQCNNAKIEIENPKQFTIKHLSDSINTHFAEFSPVLTLDASAMFFTSRRVRPDSSNLNLFSPENGKHYDDVYVSYKNPVTKEWGTPQLLEYISRPRSNEATISVSGDGQILFIYRDEDLYYSEFDGEQYGRLKFIGKDMNTDINTDAWETHATLSADGNTLYFVSDREGGLGGRDIYRAVRLPNGNWSKSLNIGPPINTKNDEDAPFFHPDGKTLFFSSNGETSMGGFDIFFTKMEGDNKWSTPVSMGYPLNSVDDDIFFVTNTEGNIGYFASAKEDGGSGGQDIYTVEMETVIDEPVAILKGYVVNTSGEPIPPNTYMLVSNLTEGGDPDNFSVRKRDGGYVMTLKPCNEYLVEYFADNNKFSEAQFLVPCEGSGYHEFGGTLDLGQISMESRYHWQIYSDGKKLLNNSGVDVKYMNEYGDELFSETLTDEGTFNFHAVDKEIFEMKLKNRVSCNKLEISLVDDADKTVRTISLKDGCKVTKEKVHIIGIQKEYINIPAKRFQIMSNGLPVTSGHFIDFIDISGNKKWHETINSQGIFKYHKIDNEPNNIFELSIDDISLCDNVEIALIDKKNQVISKSPLAVRCNKYVAESITGSYQEFFGYNVDDKTQLSASFKKFISDSKKIYALNGKCVITILGSASTVPTKTHKTNLILAQKRADKAKKKIQRALKKANIDTGKIEITVESKVQGPAYSEDARNRKKYGAYQYVSVSVK
ncbi:MAG: hypothetical protein HON99_04395 [Crocinitomicaceae bacterium]|nr:hypothetical protein [Crocinitomicaceae bacterium]